MKNSTAEMSSSEAQQREAIRVARHGRPREKARLVAGALRELVRDPEQTEQVFRIGLVLHGGHFERFEAMFEEDEEGRWLLAHRPAIDSRSVDFAALRALPADTLGGAYARFLEEGELSPDLFQPPPGLPEKATYLIQRARQTHDLWHVVTGYGSDVLGEVELQAFYFGQAHVPLSALLMAVGFVRRGWRTPGFMRRLIRAYRRGRRARKLITLRWEERWSLPLPELRRELGL